MNITIMKAIGAAAICVAASYSQGALAQSKPMPNKDVPQPTGTAGATAFQPGGAAMGEVEAGSAKNANANAGAQQPADKKPGFDNKPPKGAKADCHRPQGGVDASGGENIATASKDNTTCTGGDGKKAKRR
jgi:hypothetical protein